MYILLYVDDLFIAGNQGTVKKIISQVRKTVSNYHLGEVSSYLGMNICRFQLGNITINQ